MKIQIDTNNKIIKIKEIINIEEFFKELDALFPNKSWKQYSLDCDVCSKQNKPFLIDKTNTPYQPPFKPSLPYSPFWFDSHTKGD